MESGQDWSIVISGYRSPSNQGDRKCLRRSRTGVRGVALAWVGSYILQHREPRLSEIHCGVLRPPWLFRNIKLKIYGNFAWSRPSPLERLRLLSYIVVSYDLAGR